MAISIYIVDDHPIVRVGLCAIFHECGFETLGDAESAEQALDDPRLGTADVILLDIRLPGMDGLEAITRILNAYPEAKILLFSGQSNPTYQARAITLGAKGLVPKTETNTNLVEAIRDVSTGASLWSKSHVRRANLQAGRPPRLLPIDDIPLTQRELDVLIQLTHGLTNKEIATSLGIGYETVKEHVQHLLRKLGVSDRTQAAVWAVRHNLV